MSHAYRKQHFGTSPFAKADLFANLHLSHIPSFFPYIFHFIAPAALNHIFQHQIQHQRLFHVFSLFLSMLSIFQQNTRFQHYQGLYSAKIVFFSRTLTLSRFRFRRAALFGTSGFSNSIFRLNICCSERMPALVINTLHRLRHTVLRISASKRDQPVRHSTSHQKTHQRGSSLAKAPAHLSMRSTQTGSSTNPTFKLQTNKSTSIPKTHALHWHCNYDPCSGFCDCS